MPKKKVINKVASETAEWWVFPSGSYNSISTRHKSTAEQWNSKQLRVFLTHLAPDRLPKGRDGRKTDVLREVVQAFIQENVPEHDMRKKIHPLHRRAIRG